MRKLFTLSLMALAVAPLAWSREIVRFDGFQIGTVEGSNVIRSDGFQVGTAQNCSSEQAAAGAFLLGLVN